MPESVIALLTEYALRLAVLLIALMVVALIREGRRYLIARIGDTNYHALLRIGEVIVRQLEQEGLLQQWDGPSKKQMGMVLLAEAASRLGLQVSEETLSSILEAGVQVINTEAGKFDAQGA